MSADQAPQVPANNIPAAQAVLPAPQQPQPAVATAVAPDQETLEVNVRVVSIYLFSLATLVVVLSSFAAMLSFPFARSPLFCRSRCSPVAVL